jgi:hypothetical protein
MLDIGPQLKLLQYPSAYRRIGKRHEPPKSGSSPSKVIDTDYSALTIQDARPRDSRFSLAIHKQGRAGHFLIVRVFIALQLATDIGDIYWADKLKTARTAVIGEPVPPL